MLKATDAGRCAATLDILAHLFDFLKRRFEVPYNSAVRTLETPSLVTSLPITAIASHIAPGSYRRGSRRSSDQISPSFSVISERQ